MIRRCINYDQHIIQSYHAYPDLFKMSADNWSNLEWKANKKFNKFFFVTLKKERLRNGSLLFLTCLIKLIQFSEVPVNVKFYFGTISQLHFLFLILFFPSGNLRICVVSL